MGAPDLLQMFRRDGFALSLLPSGGLAVQPASKLTEPQRQAIREHKAEIVAALSALPVFVSIPTHAGTWTDQDIETFNDRVAMFTRRGLNNTEAERLADSLVTRDRDDTGLRICLECSGLSRRGFCQPAQRGLVAGAGRVLEPVVTQLQRCEGFTS